MTQRYVVPEEAKAAIRNAVYEKFKAVVSKPQIETVLEAFIRWQDGELKRLKETVPHKQAKPEAYKAALEDLRRMYLAEQEPPKDEFGEAWNNLTVEINRIGIPKATEILRSQRVSEPEVDVQGFSDLWWNGVPLGFDSNKLSDLHNEQIRTAWNRAKALYSAPETEVPEEKVCPVESILKASGIVISNDWLCPGCERVHEAILAPETSVKDVDEFIPDGYPTVDGDMHYQCTVCAARIDGLGCCAAHGGPWKKPEPSVPEDIKDLLWQGKKSFHHQPHELNKCHDENVNEAYRRGKAQK